MSEVNTAFVKLHTIQSQYQVSGKSGYNSFSNYAYPKIEDIITPARPLLAELKCVLTFKVHSLESRVNFTEDGNFYSIAACSCTVILTDIETGNEVLAQSFGQAMDKNGDKASFKAITGAKKYALLNLFNLITDEDPENDKYTVEKTAKKQSSKPPTTSKPTQTISGKDTVPTPKTPWGSEGGGFF